MSKALILFRFRFSDPENETGVPVSGWIFEQPSGFVAGDRLQRDVGRVLRRLDREKDLPGRHGGFRRQRAPLHPGESFSVLGLSPRINLILQSRLFVSSE